MDRLHFTAGGIAKMLLLVALERIVTNAKAPSLSGT
jgi:hypothetical protein